MVISWVGFYSYFMGEYLTFVNNIHYNTVPLYMTPDVLNDEIKRIITHAGHRHKLLNSTFNTHRSKL